MSRPEASDRRMEIEFKTRNEKQIRAANVWIDDTTEQILYGGAKGGGKSFLGASLIFADALMYPDTHYFIARKELIDLRRYTMPTIAEFFEKIVFVPSNDDERKVLENFKDRKKLAQYLAPYNGQDHVYNLRNGSKVHLISCPELPSDPLYERFGSMQMTRGWEEEGGEIPEDAHQNLWLSIGRWKNEQYNLPPKLLITANPKKGWMKRDFVDPFDKGLLPKTRAYIQAFASDNTYLPPSYEQKLLADPNKTRRQRLALGIWDYDDDRDSLVTFDALTDAFSNTVVKDGKKYMIVDVARKGRDTTVFSFWNGLELYRIEQFSQQLTDTTEQKIKDYAALEKVAFSLILVDEDGIGGGVVDHLVGVKGFTGGSTPIPTAHQIRERVARVEHNLIPKTAFGNLKAQCGWKMAELINEHKVAFKVPEYREKIIEEVGAILRDADPESEGRKYLRDKAETKRELLRSPDIGDTILMRALFELKKEASIVDEPAHAQAMEEQSMRLMRNKRDRASRSNK